MMKRRLPYLLLLLAFLLAGCSKLEKDGLYYYYFSDRDDIYIVTVPKSVSMGVVRLSAVFQETHLFGWTSPDFVIFGAFDA